MRTWRCRTDTQNPLCLISVLTVKPEPVNCYTVALKQINTYPTIHQMLTSQQKLLLLFYIPTQQLINVPWRPSETIHNYFCFPSQQAKLQMYAAHYFYQSSEFQPKLRVNLRHSSTLNLAYMHSWIKPSFYFWRTSQLVPFTCSCMHACINK